MNGNGTNQDLIVPASSVEPVPRLALSARELSESLGVSERTIATWQGDGTGPPSVKLGRLRLYPIDDVKAWLRNRSRQDADPPDGS